MQFSKTLRSAVSLCVTVAMLVSMLAVFGAFPVAAAKSVEKFTANFSALPAGQVSMTDTATVEYLENLFDFYYFQQGWWFQRADVNGYVTDADGNYLTGKTSGISYMPDVVGQKAGAYDSQYVDGTGSSLSGRGISRWLVSGKYLGCTAYADAKESAFSKVNSMWVKGDDGDLAVLDNFNLEMDFKPADATLYGKIGTNMDGIAVWFRAKNAGQAYGNNDQQMISMAPDGGLYVGNLGSSIANAAYTETMQYNDAAVTFDRAKDYHLSLTVVGTEMTVVVTDNATDKVVYMLSRPVKDLPAGYLGIGGSTAGAYYGNIEITRLDKDGNPVDFNDHNDGYGFGADFARITDYRQRFPQNTAGSKDYYANGTYLRDNGANIKWLDVVAYNTNTYDFSAPDTYAADAAVVDYLNSKFAFYYNRESVFKQFDTPYENSVVQDPDATNGSGKTVQWKLQDGRYLNAVFTAQGSQTFRKTVSIAPKDKDGNVVTAKNFETEFDMNLTTTAKTGLAFTFRAGTAGKLTSGSNASLADKVTVVFTADGYKVYDGAIPKDECVTPVVNAWADDASVTKAHVYIKAVDNILTMQVTGADGTVYYTGSTELTRTAEGSMFYSVLNGTGGFANIRADRLDDAGSVVQWDAAESLKVSFTSATGVLSTTSDDYANVTKAFNAYYDSDGALTKTEFVQKTGYGVFDFIYQKKLQARAGSTSKTAYLQFVKSLTPKTADGNEAVLKNFELTFTTNWANFTLTNNGVGAIVIGLRQQTAGKFTTAAGQLDKNQGLIIISPDGITFAGGNDITNDMYGIYNDQFFDTRLNPAPYGDKQVDSTYHTVKVRVVGNQATVTIGSKTYTGNINYDAAGYLSFGVGAYRSDFGDITVTRLDDAGNAIDWNADQYEAIPTTVTFDGTNLLGFNTTYTNKYPNDKDNIEYTDTALTVAQRAAFIDALDSRFDVYYNDYDGANAVYIHNSSVVGNTVGYNYAKLQYYQGNAWLRLVEISGYGSLTGSALRQVGSLVPKDDDGEHLYLKNFEMNTGYAFWTGSTGNGAVIIGFRQEQPGRYYTDNGLTANGSYLMISNDKLLVYENGTLLHEQAFSDANNGRTRNVNIKVVGKTLTYRVHWSSSTVLSGTVELSTEKTGYLALSNTHYLRSFSTTGFSITALDDAGQATPIKNPASSNTNGNITVSTNETNGVYTNTITVTPEEGYEMLAGSLIATDAEGNVYVPTRVGFRNGGNASQYEVKCASPVKATATFYQPTAADPNVGNIGTSINEELAGLRFVSRLARTVDGDTEYVTLDGETFEVVDYGMLVAVKSVLGTDVLSLNTTETNPYIRQLSIKNNNVYYDVCDAYIDMSVCITNVDKVNGGTEMDVVARPYAVVKDANGEEVALYAQSFTSNYAENAGLATVTFSELEKDGVVKTIGRAGVVGNELQMDWVNTGFEIKGTLMGAVKVNMTSEREDSLLNVSVDGKAPTVLHVPSGSSTVTLASNLSKGEHTIRVESGTSVRWGTLSAVSLQYLGELDTISKQASNLRMTVLGDSISCAWGMGVARGGTYTNKELVAASNAYNSYAAITARNLGADLDVVARCSQTIRTIHSYSMKLNRRSGAPAWDWEEQDIVIVNLGTNDEWKEGFTPETALEDATALLEDMREISPDAYIIYVYSMMTDYTIEYADYLVSYKAAVQSLVDKGDDKVFMLQMTPNNAAYEGHPDTAAQAAYADVLTAFIQENCSELFGHTTHTETMGALTTANKVLFTDRTAASGTARTMTYSNTGITLEGYLYGELKMNVAVEKETCAINVIVDGDTINATTVWVEAGEKEVTLLSDLRRGNHTIEIVKGTAHHAGLLTMKDITYTGTLTTPTAKDLQIAFIGDSVTVGEGMYGNITPLAKSYNSIDGYASQVARYLGAGVTTIAKCGAKIPGMTTQFNAAQDGEKDIVVINLGTNDFGWNTYADYDITTDCYPDTTTTFVSAITGLIDDVREAQPDAYIIWTYGMMFDQHLDALKGIVEGYAQETDDDKLLFCDLSAAKDNSGKSSHPSTVGNNNAALVLTGFIRENCADVLTSVATPAKTFADGVLKVACVGDSITALGYWENNLRSQLSTDRYTVSGFGVSGSTAGFKGVDYVDANTNAGKAYVDQTAYTNALAYGADIVVIMLGTNDSKIVNWPYYADEFVADYVKIVRSFQNQANAPMVFIGLPPTVYSTGDFQDVSNSRIENFIIPALYEVAAQTGAVIVDTHTPTSGDSTLMTDGVHPADAGKQILCETFAAAIKAKVEG